MLPALLFAAALLPQASPQQPCDTAARVAAVHAVQARLFTIATPSEDDVPYDTPESLAVTSDAIPALHTALSAAVTSFMQCDAGTLNHAGVFEARIASLLGGEPAKPLQPGDTEDDSSGGNASTHLYGDAVSVRATRLPGLDGALALDLSFSIACSADHQLLVFQKNATGWERLLDWHSSKFEDASDAFGDFFSFMVVPGPNEEKRMLVAHGTPWCSSTMSEFKVDLLSLDSTSDVKAQHAQGEYRRFFDDHMPALKTVPHGAALAVTADSHDGDMMTYPELYEWQTDSGELRRVPVAVDARTFFEQWLNAPWDVAKTWALRPESALEALHHRFNYQEQQDAKDAKKAAAPPGAPEQESEDTREFSYGPLQACRTSAHGPIAKGQFQVSFSLAADKADENDEDFFVQVEQHGRVFQMMSVTAEANPLCGAPDLKPLDE